MLTFSRKTKIILFTLFFLALLFVYAWPRLGLWIVEQDTFDHADLAVVLSGNPVQRSLAARDLYLQRKIDRVLIIPEPRDQTIEKEMIKLGLKDPHKKTVPTSEAILVKSGVPKTAIAFFPQPVDGTILEAPAIHNFLEGHMPKKMVVITSRFASRRACTIFRQVFKNDPVDIFCSPTSYDSFNPKKWSEKPRDALYVLMEYQKLVVNFFTLNF